MSTPDTGPTPKGKRRVRVPFQPRERNVTEREYEALQRAGFIKENLPPKQAQPTPAPAPTPPETRRRPTTAAAKNTDTTKEG
ncbi:hypothetical protein ACWFMI_23535 [Nocardiopsis terrae]|uniref:hypothetical protein n=1 Tax=Streptomyces sp. NPDC057554 TaxID=3350538 RepID=UPI0036C47CE3